MPARWELEPFKHFSQHHERIHNFYHLTIEGLNYFIFNAERIENLTRQIEELSGKNEDHHSLENAKARAAIAKQEADFGFPTLVEQQIVSYWTSLECLVEDFLVSLLSNHEPAMQIQEITKIKISVADYTKMQGIERYYYLVDELERSLKSRLRRGAEQFEAVLNVFGLSGEISADMRRDLLELEGIRNLYLHRRGIVDHRFRQACPWLKVEVGTKIAVAQKDCDRYFNAIMDYASVLLDRVSKRFITLKDAMPHPPTD